MNKSIFLILGLSNGGLFLARQLRKEFPSAVVLAIGNDMDIGKFSFTISRFYPANNAEEVNSAIMSILDSNLRQDRGRIRAFLTSNPMLEYAVFQFPQWFDLLEFENTYGTYSQLVDKSQVSALCSRMGITMPREYDLLNENLSALAFPVIVKPREKTETIGAKKCAIFEDSISLTGYLEHLKSLHIPVSKLICQKAIEGDNRWEYGFGGYYLNGVPIVSIAFYQFRQNPQGLCCYAREMTDQNLVKDVASFVNPIVKELKYSGFIEFDIKQDSKTKQLFLLDVNPRPWRSVDMLSVKIGVSSVFSPLLKNDYVEWRYPAKELFSNKNRKNVPYALCRKITGNAGFIKFKALFDREDTKPYLIQRKRDIRSMMKSLLRRIL